MKIRESIREAVVLTKKAEPSKKDPNIIYYRIGILMGDELGELRCTKEAYDAVTQGKPYTLGYCFNSEYGSFVIETAMPLK